MTEESRTRWLVELARLLPEPDEQHPRAFELVAYAAGELAGARRDLVAAHLAACGDCQRLERGARAGLDEAGRVEQGLAALGAAAATQAPEAAPSLHLPLVLGSTPALRALAADGAAPARAPVPEDRRVLLEVEGLLRAVYYRIGVEATVAVFAERVAELEVSVALDDQPLAAARDPEAVRFALGPAGALAGRVLELTVAHDGDSWRRSFTLIEEPP
jgi:hypothetical protein